MLYYIILYNILHRPTDFNHYTNNLSCKHHYATSHHTTLHYNTLPTLYHITPHHHIALYNISLYYTKLHHTTPHTPLLTQLTHRSLSAAATKTLDSPPPHTPLTSTRTYVKRDTVRTPLNHCAFFV